LLRQITICAVLLYSIEDLLQFLLELLEMHEILPLGI
jgi:hypothetical protein